MNNLQELTIFIKRMKKIGIVIELIGNFPWIYLDKVNSNIVKDLYYGNHGYTIAFYPRMGASFEFIDIKDLFKIIRKYK